MCFGCPKEPSYWEGSFEHPQHMFWLRNKKNNFQIYLEAVDHWRLFVRFLLIRQKIFMWHIVAIQWHCLSLSDPEVIFFPCSTELRLKFIMLVNIKMSTIVGILKFISMINTTSENLKVWKVSSLKHYRFYEQLKFHAQLSMKKVNNTIWLQLFYIELTSDGRYY